jgi:hypothetical protein
MLQNGYVDSLIHGLALDRNSWCTRSSASKKAISIVSTFDQTCLAFFGRGANGWFLRMLVAFRTFLWPSYQVSGRIWCKHVAPSTHPFHNTMEGQTRLHCRSTHSRMSQAAIRSSGMWHQEMLPSILHGCHFDTISSFSIKNSVPDDFDQTSYKTTWHGNPEDHNPIIDILTANRTLHPLVPCPFVNQYVITPLHTGELFLNSAVYKRHHSVWILWSTTYWKD